jgi:VanZ family protein
MTIKKFTNNLNWARITVGFVVALIFAGSSIPGRNIPTVFTLTPDKLIHCAEYAVLGVFLFHWVRLEFNSFSLLKVSIFTFLIGSLIGVLDENYQRLTPGRTTNIWDWVLDSVGVLLAIGLMNYLTKRSTLLK